MREEFLSIAKNCVICLAAGITITIAVKYLKDHNGDFSLQSFFDVSSIVLISCSD